MMALGMALFAGMALAQQGPAPSPQKGTPAVTSQKQAPTAKGQKDAPATTSQKDDPTFKSQKDKVSYGLGVEVARSLKWQAIKFDPDLVIKGFRDALAGEKLLMSEEDLSATLKAFREERQQDMAHAWKMRAEKNKQAGEEFIAQNVKKDGVVTLPSGLQYKILKQGDGKKPTADDTVVCHYRGTLVDGTEFDSSYKRNQPATFPVKKIIKGWAEALQLMPVGSKWQLFMPPQLAYGERGAPGVIGPNATLLFEVELVSIQDPAIAQASEKKDSMKK